MTPEIPADINFPGPFVGTVGFRGTPHHPPQSWEFQHVTAERGGYFRVGRLWFVAASYPLPFFCAPVSTIYRLLIARRGWGVAAEGWCVDA